VHMPRELPQLAVSRAHLDIFVHTTLKTIR
jgi:hypothetical protein